MIVKINKEVAALTDNEIAVLKKLGATLENRKAKRFAYVSNELVCSFDLLMPETNGWEFVSYLRDYKLHPEEITSEEAGELDRKQDTIIPIYAYIHGGISLSLDNVWPYNDKWDSGIAGLAVFKGKATKENIKELQEYIDFYNNFNSGNIFEVGIVDEFDNSIDNCSGLTSKEVKEFAKEHGVNELDIIWRD